MNQYQPKNQHFVSANGMKLCVEERGDPNDPAVVLIMGLAAQMILWPEEIVERLVSAGYRVIRFDNRDIGQSQKIKSHKRSNRAALLLRYKLGKTTSSVDYTLHDMAKDTAELLTQLAIPKAHIVGASMGGMIAQLFAAHYPEKTLSLTAIMSSNNSPRAPSAKLGLTMKLVKPISKQAGVSELIKRQVEVFRLIQSSTYPMDDNDLNGLTDAMFNRDPKMSGAARQLNAILATGDLTPYYSKIKAPTLVIHGEQDPLLPPAAGRLIADGIVGAKFELVPHMAHDLPKQLISQLVASMVEHFRKIS